MKPERKSSSVSSTILVQSMNNKDTGSQRNVFI